MSTAFSYIPLSESPQPAVSPADQRRLPIKVLSFFLFSVLLVSCFIALVVFNPQQDQEVPLVNDKITNNGRSPATLRPWLSRGVSQGVSEKAFSVDGGGDETYPWSNVMLSWQRTSYHFQPEKNWMNDPNGPLFHLGWYHIFYQYNPDSAVWGNIVWGHSVSKDMIHWFHLPFAMVPDQWYDINGVWSGSATFLPDGRIVMIYTGDTNDFVQVQCLAWPANLSDPLLLDWVKYSGNPVLVPPPGIGTKDFRDPTTAWVGPDGVWRLTIGSKVNKTGTSLVYKTTNFTNYELLDEYLHEVPGTGMWECVDFYPVSTTDKNGLDTSVNGPDVKHVLKASLDDDKHDYYALGTYDPVKDKWNPDKPELDVGIGLRVDYGKYYASKTFYDHHKKRRVMWGWTGETDSEATDLLKGWASVQTIPRTVVFDKKTKANILQWPIEEVNKLRNNGHEFKDVKLAPGSVVPLKVGLATQLDISAKFKIDEDALEGIVAADVGYNCTTSGGSAGRGVLGPFGLLVLADESLTEQTPVYFYIAKGADGSFNTYFCTDQSRSSNAPDVGKLVYGSSIPVLDDEKFTMRLLVDHSVVESFGQGGRRVITARVYPTKAIYTGARVFLFNNATGISVKASVKIWHMNSAYTDSFATANPS